MHMEGLEQHGRGAGAAPLQYPYLSASLFKYPGGFFPLPATKELLQCTGCSQSDAAGQDACCDPGQGAGSTQKLMSRLREGIIMVKLSLNYTDYLFIPELNRPGPRHIPFCTDVPLP